ncbi:MAG: 23S rRNA (uracil(1939)-C(5))-methyltransferase RlmD [Geminicoccaceae bacterium]
MIGREVELLIETMGRGGDGVGRFENTRIYVPFALPDDRLRVRLTEKRGEGFGAVRIDALEEAPRAEPVCRHFSTCGGCQLQHLLPEAYRLWRSRHIEAALASRGLVETPMRPLIDGVPAARRRVRLAFGQEARGPSAAGKPVNLGFRGRNSQSIVAITQCPVAAVPITDLLAPLRRLLAGLSFSGSGGELLLTLADSGMDLLLQSAGSLDLADREALAGFAERQDLARLAWRQDAEAPSEPIAARRPVRVTMGGIGVDLPIGAFLQATRQAEEAILAAVSDAIGDSRRIADLFAGCGAFSLPFAATCRDVLAIERDPAMVNAMKAGVLASGINARFKAAARDLDHQPLLGDDLAHVDAVVLDPPRAGARSQVEALARSAIPRIAMVSCNPTTFTRDARILVDGGYRLSWVQPIDAFLWSAEIELVGAFKHVTAS